jgi:hypothetical protein
MAISEGRARAEVMAVLHSKIETLEKDLANDKEALDWFDIGTEPSISSTPPPSVASTTTTLMPHMTDKFERAPSEAPMIHNDPRNKFKGELVYLVLCISYRRQANMCRRHRRSRLTSRVPTRTFPIIVITSGIGIGTDASSSTHEINRSSSVLSIAPTTIITSSIGQCQGRR